MTVGYFRTGIDGSLIDINPACLKTFGFSGIEDAREQLNNTTSGVYSSKSEWQMVRDRMLSGAGSFSGIVNLKRSDGTEFKGGLNMRLISGPDGAPQFIEGLVDDVTEREKTQEMLIQSEKMITWGLAVKWPINQQSCIISERENALHRCLMISPNICAKRVQI
jgi:PAS domain S-box-containing protein